MILEGYIAAWKKYPVDEVKIRVAWPSILGPSKKLLGDYKEGRVSWNEYEIRYREEITGNPEAVKRLIEVCNLSKTKNVRLMCYEKQPPCHRFILLEMITRILGPRFRTSVPEMTRMICPYQDICATILFWKNKKADYIKEVCETKKYTTCTHFLGLDANPSWVEEARRRKPFESMSPMGPSEM